MNVLPVVFSLLIVLSISSSSMFEKRVDSKRFTNSFTESFEMNREVFADIEMDKYKECKSDHPQKKTEGNLIGSEEKKEDNQYTEKINQVKHCGKLNLYPLLSLEDPKEDVIYQTALRFFQRSYSQLLPTYKKDLDKILEKLLDAVIASAKNQEEESLSLEKIHIEDQFLHNIFYRALKGTNYYSFEQKVGYPSLINYFLLSNDKEEQKICFPHISKEMLSAIFSQECANNIYQAYKDHKHISKTVLEQILLDSGFTLDDNINKLLRKTHKKTGKMTKTIYTGKDQKDKSEKSVSVYNGYR